MAEIHSQSMSERINELIQRAEASRKSLSQAGENLKVSSNFGQRLQNSIRGNLTAWLGSAAVIGLVLAKLPARKKKIYINANAKAGTTKTTEAAAKGGMFVAVMGLVFQLARPILQKLLVEQFGLYANKFQANRAAKMSSAKSSEKL